MPAIEYKGTFDNQTNAATAARPFVPRQEGLRQGGHAFVVSETSTASANFEPSDSPQTGGSALQSEPTASMSFVDFFVFRDSSTDAIFTICVTADVADGSRVST